MSNTDYAGKTVRLIESATHFQYPEFGGQEFHVEDLDEVVFGQSWGFMTGNPAAMVYGMRSAENNLPLGGRVYYGKLGAMGCLIHEDEIAGIVGEQSS